MNVFTIFIFLCLLLSGCKVSNTNAPVRPGPSAPQINAEIVSGGDIEKLAVEAAGFKIDQWANTGAWAPETACLKRERVKADDETVHALVQSLNDDPEKRKL